VFAVAAEDNVPASKLQQEGRPMTEPIDMIQRIRNRLPEEMGGGLFSAKALPAIAAELAIIEERIARLEEMMRRQLVVLRAEGATVEPGDYDIMITGLGLPHPFTVRIEVPEEPQLAGAQGDDDSETP
jgi:hypothetical protein